MPVAILLVKLLPVMSPASSPVVTAFRDQADRITLVKTTHETVGKSRRELTTLHVTVDGRQRLELKLWNMTDAQVVELEKSLRNVLPNAWQADVPRIEPAGPVT